MPQISKDKSDPYSVDFSALNTLRTVYRAKSFTEAAEILNVNQSAVSYTIERLRQVFHDPLFVREAGRQTATARCHQIVANCGQMLDQFLELARPEEFEPHLSKEKVSIACNFYERVLIIPKMVQEIRRLAPNMKIEISDSKGMGHLQLMDNQADVLIGPFARQEAGFFTRRLFHEHYVCLMDPKHPAALEDLSLERYLALDHIYIDYAGNWKSRYLTEIEEQGAKLNVALSVPSPAGIAQVVRGSQLVATVPFRLANLLQQDLIVKNCPVRGEFDVGLVWTARTHSSPMYKWLRNLIAENTD